MNPSIPEYLLWTSVISSGTVLLAWAGTKIAHRISAAWKHFFWLLALFAPLVALPILVGNIRFELPILPEQKVNADFGMEATAQLFPRGSESRKVERESDQPIASVVPVLPFVWTAVVCLMLVRLAAAHFHLGRILSRTHGVAKEHNLSKLLSERAPTRSGWRIVWSSETSVPFCCGLLKKTIVFPVEASKWSDVKLRACLNHEVAHLRRNDPLALTLAHLSCAFFWFNPLVWMAASNLRALAEIAADDSAVHENMTPECYASNLLSVSEEVLRMRWLLPVLPMARKGGLKERVRNILSDSVSRNSPGRRSLSFSLFTVIIIVAGTSSIRLGAVGSPGLEGAVNDSISITVQNQPEDPKRRVKSPVARLDASSIENMRTISSAFESAKILKKDERVFLSGSNATFIQIDIRFQGELISLRSVHPIYEATGNFVGTSHLLVPRGDRTIEEVVEGQPEFYQKFRRVFDEIYQKVVGEKFEMSEIFEANKGG